ncbi:MAG: hypothetical protein HPY69_04470, partial [Armatimonadetes bacterium]|nr:hypothetical protein [Armatimonadota bacterium]
LIIIHNPPQTHNVPWSITHAAREGPTFTVTVEVCDMSGGVVVTHSETQVGPGSGSWTWDGKINGVDAAKGLYISRVYTSHYFQGAGGCSDRDKTDVLSEVSVDGFQWVTGQYPTRAQVTLHYTLSEALTNCVVTAYKPDLSTTAVHVPANGALSGTGGAHNVTVEFAVDPQICGTYRFVITGDQASGAGNRDEQAKPTVPEGASVDIWPPAMNWHSPTWASDFACCCEYGAQMQGEPHGGSHYAADAAHSLPVASELVDHLLSDAVISLHSHSGPGYTHIIARDQNGNETAANFCAMHYSFYTPGRDVALSDYQGDLSQLRFILFNGCETGAMSPPFTGPSLVSAAEDAGVDASLGFNEPIFMDQSGLWTHWFWYYACEMGCTVSDAHAEAFDEVLGLLGGNTDWRLFDVAVSGGMCDIVPARYGQ